MDWRVGPIVLGLACVAVLGGAAGGVDAPVVDVGGEYDVSVDPGAVLTVPESTASGGAAPSGFEVYGVDVAAGGSAGWLGAGWMVALLGLWVLVAMRTMNAASSLGALALAAVVLAGALLVGFGGAPSGAADPAGQEVGLLGQLVFVLLGLVTVLSGVALVLPDDADAYSAQVGVFGVLAAAGRDLLRRGHRRLGGVDDDGAVAPENEVYEAWLDVARRHGGPDRTPGEVARAAEDAGAPVDPVRDLQRVFEEVRYGGASPTEDRVERARAARRRAREPDGEPSDGGTPDG